MFWFFRFTKLTLIILPIPIRVSKDFSHFCPINYPPQLVCFSKFLLQFGLIQLEKVFMEGDTKPEQQLRVDAAPLEDVIYVPAVCVDFTGKPRHCPFLSAAFLFDGFPYCDSHGFPGGLLY